MKKKVIAALLVTAMAIPLLAGCGGEKTPSGSSGGSGGSGGSQGSGDGMKTLRILGVDHAGNDKEGNTVKLSDWVNGDSKLWQRFVSDLEARGLKLELDLIEADQYETTVNNQLAAGLDYDWVYVTPLSTDTRLNLVEQKKIQPLNKIWNELSKPETKEFFETGEGRDVVRLNTLEDGNIYWVSTAIIGTYGDSYFGSFTTPLIRKDWLQKLNLKMPETADELYNTLKAFRDQDANGNGEPDEIASLELDTFAGGIAQLFGIGYDYGRCYVDYYTGKVTTGWYDKNVKEYINFMRKLYAEGLLLDKGADASAYSAENKLGLIYDWALETWDEPGIIVSEGEPAPYYQALMFEAVKGTAPLMARQRGIQKAGYDYVATDKADPAAVAIYLDYIASKEYSLLSEFGIEGYSFEYNDKGEMIQYTSTEINENASISEVQVIVQVPALWVNNGIAPRVQRVDRKQEVDMTKSAGDEMGYPNGGFEDKVALVRDIYENEGKYSYAAMGIDKACSTKAEADEVNSFFTDLETREAEILLNLVMGNYSMDDWDTYIKELQDLGLDKLIEIYQSQYDRAWAE